VATIEALETALVACITRSFDAADGVRVVDHEPEVTGELPVVWIRWLGADPIQDVETGKGQDWVEQWMVELVLEAGGSFEDVQTKMKTLLPKLLDGFRLDPTLGDVAGRCSAGIDSEPAFFKRGTNPQMLYGVQVRLGAEHTRNAP
jgi:hypothetical protein